VNEAGRILPIGQFHILSRNTYVFEPGAQIFEGIPPEIADQAPQGFMGRAFAQLHSQELDIPLRPQDWSNDHILYCLARRGEDLPGNLIVGLESANRWTQQKLTPTSLEDYPTLAKKALSGQPQGSSAGGEQPKFSVFTGQHHCLVKFVTNENTTATTRWRDLLICESIALQTLNHAGIQAATTEVFEREGFTFLQTHRFDREGDRGRRSVLTLAAIDDLWFGNRDNWTEASERLSKFRKISTKDAHNLKLLDAFGMLIGDSDRHFHNIAFFPDLSTEKSLEINHLKLGPAFDKLPMMFAPIQGALPQREFQYPLYSPKLMDVWPQAVDLSLRFWSQVEQDQRISHPFRTIAETCKREILKNQ
jgi:hypothetical protein